jgi:YidC/Oxa1 family membrane protein insertase
MQTSMRSLLPLLLAGVALAQTAPDTGFVRTFGAPDATGSFRARFAYDGGGLVFLQATDHYVTLDAARKEKHEPGDYLLLAFSPALPDGSAEHGLRLLLGQPSTAFPKDPGSERWQVAGIDGGDALTFTLDGGAGLELEKVLRHDPVQRGFVLEIALRNKSAQGATGTLDLTLTGPTLVSPSELSLFGTLAVAIAVGADGVPQVVTPAEATPHAFPIDGRTLAFAGSTNRFFGAFLWPKDDGARQALGSAHADRLPFRDEPAPLDTKAGSTTRMRYGLKLPIPAIGAESRATFGLYFGPKSTRVFATLPEPERFEPILDVDLKAPCCFGIEVPGGKPMARVLLWLLRGFHDLVGNWGVAIMMLTILVRGLLSPLNFHMQKSMRAYSARMAKLKPKLDEIKTRHGDDKQAYQQAMIAFQREHKLIPPLGGCLPVFLTMPIYLGLFTALRTAYDLRQQPFVSWIDDLSLPDCLATLPFWPHQFNLLPLLWIALMVIQMLRQPMPTDPQQRQTMMIMRYMPLLFGVMLYYYASALLVYMVTSMLWTFVESAIVKKILGPIDPNVAAFTPQPI